LLLSRTPNVPARTRFAASGRERAPAIVVIAGTRPECIKLAPVIRRLGIRRHFRVVVVNSGQHVAAVQRTFAEFGIRSTIELAALPSFSHLGAACAHLQTELVEVLARERPAAVIVQGDTLTAYAGARAASEAGYPLAHVEAGLRTDSVGEPFPEEWFRRRIARHAQLHFAPSRSGAQNLLDEGVASEAVHRVGNTGIDSLRWVLDELGIEPRAAAHTRDLVLVTVHRRENFDRNAALVCDALFELSAARPELRLLFPIHPNPRIAHMFRRRLAGLSACRLTEPMGYAAFIEQAAQAALIISDSGGIQEEAPHLGTPLLVPRINTERPESLETGFVRLVRVGPDSIAAAALEMVSAPPRPPVPMDADAPFGAGDAAGAIVRVLEAAFSKHAFA